VEEDAELGVAKPVGSLIPGERVPGGLIERVVCGIAVGGADFRYLARDVCREVRMLRQLCEEGRRDSEERDEGEKVFHCDTIAEGGVVL
jgi:hypothetical protein